MAKDYQYPGTMPFERHVFEKERLGIDFHLSKREMEMMKGWEMQRFEEDMGRSIVWRVTTMMAHGDKTVQGYVEVPVDWLDHLKLALNVWAKRYLLRKHFFFTNIAEAIQSLQLRPKFRTIETSTVIKNFCPHITVGDNRPHVEFMLQRPFNYLKGAPDDKLPYGGTSY